MDKDESPKFSSSNSSSDSAMLSSPITHKDCKSEALLFQAITLIHTFIRNNSTYLQIFWAQYVYPTVRAYRAMDTPSEQLQCAMRQVLVASAEFISRQDPSANRYLLDIDRYLLDFFPNLELYLRLEGAVSLCSDMNMEVYHRALYNYAKMNELEFDSLFYYVLIVKDGERVKKKFPHLQDVLTLGPLEKTKQISNIIGNANNYSSSEEHESKISKLRQKIASTPVKKQNTPTPLLSSAKMFAVIDTNVLIADTLGYLSEFIHLVQVCIPLPVIEEIYDLCRNPTKAALATRALDFLINNQAHVKGLNRLGEVVPLSIKEPVHSFRLFGKMDDQIIESCLQLSRRLSDGQCVFVTDDLNAMLKTKAEGLCAMCLIEFTELFFIK